MAIYIAILFNEKRTWNSLDTGKNGFSILRVLKLSGPVESASFASHALNGSSIFVGNP